jgi:hypothetical protein
MYSDKQRAKIALHNALREIDQTLPPAQATRTKIAILRPFGELSKLAAMEGEEEWLASFRGTPLHPQAIELSRKALVVEQGEAQARDQSDQIREQARTQMSTFESQRKAIEMEKAMLKLQLEEMVATGGAQITEPAAPPEALQQAAAQGQKMAAASGWVPSNPNWRGPAPGWAGAAARGLLQGASTGFRPGVGKSVAQHFANHMVPGAVLGAAGGYMAKDPNESTLGAIGRGAFVGGAMGGVTAGVSGYSRLSNGQGLKGVNKSIRGALSDESRAALVAKSRASSTANRAAKAPAGSPAPAPPAAAAAPIELDTSHGAATMPSGLELAPNQGVSSVNRMFDHSSGIELGTPLPRIAPNAPISGIELGTPAPLPPRRTQVLLGSAGNHADRKTSSELSGH